MLHALHIETTVLPGGRIEISAPELLPGHKAKVFVVMEEELVEKRSATDILAEASGHRLFRTVEEIEAYIREERDSWDR